MNHERWCGGVHNVRVWQPNWGQMGAESEFTPPASVTWAKGVFQAIDAPGGAYDGAQDGLTANGDGEITVGTDLDGTGLWLIPGLVDAHLHAGWQAFNASDRDALGESRTRELIEHTLRNTLAAGFTSVRDAGGLTPQMIQTLEISDRPRIHTAIELIDRARADDAGGVEHAVAGVLERGAQWVKLVATAGVASPAGSGLESHFTFAEVGRAVKLAEQAGAAVMVHAWGGISIDDAIEVGAASIEHGIFLTPNQAGKAAASGITFVPTLRIYRLVQEMILRGELPQSFAGRVTEAVTAHPSAVRVARDAGLSIALGTDYGTPEQHGTGALELDALIAAGLTPAEALDAATRAGARLLARVDPEQDLELAGRISQGAFADAVLMRRDPREAGAFQDPAAIAAVISHGRVVANASLERDPR